MSERITQSNVYGVFIHLCNELGQKCWVSSEKMKKFKKNNQYFPEPKHLSQKRNEVGTWILEYCYGGWTIAEIANEQGGQSHPFDSNRRNNREFWEAMHFARTIVRFMENKKGEERL